MFSSFKLLILTLLLAGQVNAGRIFGGKEAKPHSRPYMALVERTIKKNATTATTYCGGFLLNENYVMTAAHCEANVYKVMLGVHDVYKPENWQNISVSNASKSQDYDPNTLRNDFLLLKLSSKAVINSNVQSITLAGPEDPAPKSCSVAGWGRSDKFPSNMTPDLMEVNVTLSEEGPCANEDFYCCKGKKGSGKGDSGGPLVCENGKVYGVVSYAWEESEKPVAHFFAKIPKYKEWIDSIINTEK